MGHQPCTSGKFQFKQVRAYLFTLFADGGCVGLALLLELGAAVRALHHRERAAALLQTNGSTFM